MRWSGKTKGDIVAPKNEATACGFVHIMLVVLSLRRWYRVSIEQAIPSTGTLPVPLAPPLFSTEPPPPPRRTRAKKTSRLNFT